MKFAILAAGEGSRLAGEGVTIPKPLVRVCGEAMIDRLIRIFSDLDAEAIYIITNNLTPLTKAHLEHISSINSKVHYVVKTTPSSMHSFHELSQYLGEGKFCLTTVDTIFRENDFRTYIQEFEQSSDDGLMAVTDYVDDESPLYLSTGRDLQVTGFFDTLAQFEQSNVSKDGESVCTYISGGIYCLTDKVFPTLQRCIESGQSRMRNFQRQLVEDGVRLRAYPFSKILDVDHADDIAKAEAFIQQQP